MEHPTRPDSVPFEDAPEPPRPKPRQSILPNAPAPAPTESRPPQARSRSVEEEIIVRKPTIPSILHSTSVPCDDHDPSSSSSPTKPSSILKKRANVSFEVEESMTRTKSTDSNLSCESETGYWSSGSGSGGTRPILKGRRSSLGSDSEPNELQSILKNTRKHSLDSSALLRDAASASGSSSSPSSLSMHSISSPEPKPILKNVSSSEDLGDDSHAQPRPILKKRSGGNGANNATQRKTDETVRPILKRPTSRGSRSEEDDDELQYCTMSTSPGGTKGILKRSIHGLMHELEKEKEIRVEKEIAEVGISLAERKSMFLQMDSSKTHGSFEKRELTPPGEKSIDENVTSPSMSTSPSVASRRMKLLSSMLGDRNTDENVRPLKIEEPDDASVPTVADSIDETDTSACDIDLEVSAFMTKAPDREYDRQNEELKAAKLIKERIAALKANGEASWLKRVPEKEIPKVEILPVKEKVDDAKEKDFEKNESEVERRKDAKSNAIANRLTLLEKSQEGWKKRVSEIDAATFTVQGRLEMAGKITKSADKDEKDQRRNKIKSKLETQSEQEAGTNNGQSDSYANGSGLSTKGEADSESDSDSGDIAQVPIIDDNFEQFFTNAASLQSDESPEIEELSFSSLVGNREQMLGFRQRVRVNRKNVSKNPVKVLAARLSPDDDSGGGPVPDPAENSEKQKASLKSNLSPEALAGLQSKEDYSAIKLKRPVISTKGYPHPMLIQIKGRRFVQTKLVCPVVSSLNNGDCFILVTGADEVYQYVGEYANRLERSRSAEVLAAIKRKRDLGCGPHAVFYTLEQPYMDESLYEQFLSALGGGIPDLGEDKLGDEYDEEYETEAISANRVFKVDFKKKILVPMTGQPGWSTQPKHSLFTDDRAVLVFDFGSELYVWSGSRAVPEVKKLGTQLGREIFESSGFGSETNRPSWCWFKKLVQFMEPVLFREKFFDWPDDGEGRLKYNHRQRKETEDIGSDYSYNFEPCDPDEMLKSWAEVEEAGLELECFNVGRGKEVRDEVEMRTYVITTLDVVFCHILDFSTAQPPPICHFYATETYVIRWSYYVTHTSRDLKGGVSRHAGTRVGRDRIAYFFWHGAQSKITEKGASALMTVELDEEKGPQIRVDQGAEPPAFLTLFKGLMFIHSGSPEECRKRYKRLYVTMGGVEEEGHFVEVPWNPSSFRSRSSFVVKTEGNIIIWHGCASSTVSRKIVSKLVEQLGTNVKDSVLHNGKQSCVVMEEGDETNEFLQCLEIKANEVSEWRKSYGSSINTQFQPVPKSVTKIYHFTSIKGIFDAIPLPGSRMSSTIYDPFPNLQEELLSAQQPSLFLISTNEKTWLWQGCIQETEEENLTTGSQKFRWAAERKAALETAIVFSNHRSQEGFLVHAGYEPPEFRAMFPYWQPQCYANTDHQEKGCITLEEAFYPYRKQTYSLEELKAKPDGVDVLKLETYLSDDDFKNFLKMGRNDFDKLQAWKKTELKKQAGLF